VKGVALWSVKKNLRFRKNLKRRHAKSQKSHVRSLRRYHRKSLKRRRQKPKRVRFILGGA
jgi:hypothetical protein